MQIKNLLLKVFRSRRRSISVDDYAQEIREINDTYYRLFSTPDGVRVLEHLVQTCLTVPIATKGSDLLDIGEKQGRANLVNEMIQRIENSKTGA